MLAALAALHRSARSALPLGMSTTRRARVALFTATMVLATRGAPSLGAQRARVGERYVVRRARRAVCRSRAATSTPTTSSRTRHRTSRSRASSRKSAYTAACTSASGPIRTSRTSRSFGRVSRSCSTSGATTCSSTCSSSRSSLWHATGSSISACCSASRFRRTSSNGRTRPVCAAPGVRRRPRDRYRVGRGHAPRARTTASIASACRSTRATAQMIDRYRAEFVEEGLDTRYSSLGRNNRLDYPTFGELIAATDRPGARSGYLGRRGRVSIRARDASSTIASSPSSATWRATRRCGRSARMPRTRHLTISAFYLSNVEQYLITRDGGFDGYVQQRRARCRATARASSSAAISGGSARRIRSTCPASASISTSMIETIDNFLQRNVDGAHPELRGPGVQRVRHAVIAPPAPQPRPAAEVRILALGDSYTVGEAVRADDAGRRASPPRSARRGRRSPLRPSSRAPGGRPTSCPPGSTRRSRPARTMW